MYMLAFLDLLTGVRESLRRPKTMSVASVMQVVVVVAMVTGVPVQAGGSKLSVGCARWDGWYVSVP